MSTWAWKPYCRSSSGSSFLTALATAAELAPACFTTSTPTASTPLVRTRVRSSFIPLRTRATSPSRTTLPSAAGGHRHLAELVDAGELAADADAHLGVAGGEAPAGEVEVLGAAAAGRRRRA